MCLCILLTKNIFLYVYFFHVLDVLLKMEQIYNTSSISIYLKGVENKIIKI